MQKIYRKVLVIAILGCISSKNFSQNVAINTSGNNAYTSAILDLSNHNTVGTVGFLPPYVTLTALGTFGLLGTAAQSNGIIVYCTGLSTVPAGLYYWNNSVPTWVAIGGSSAVSADNGLTVGSFTAGDVELGGTTAAPATLKGNSVISGSGYNLDFDLGNYATATAGSGSFLVTNGGSANPYLSVTYSAATTPNVLVGVNVNPAVNTLDDNGSFGTAVSLVLTSATTLDNSYSSVLVDASGGAFTVTLPAPGASNIRRIYTITYAPSAATKNAVTISSSTAGTIILGGTLAVTSFDMNGGSVTIQSNGTDWYITQSASVFNITFNSGWLNVDATTKYNTFTNGVMAFGTNYAYSQDWDDATNDAYASAANSAALASPGVITWNNYLLGENLAISAPYSSIPTYIATSECRLNTVNVWLTAFNTAATTFDFEVWDYPAATNTGTAGLSGGVLLAKTSYVAATAGDYYDVSIPAKANIPILAGDMIVIWVKVSDSQWVMISGSMQFQSFQ